MSVFRPDEVLPEFILHIKNAITLMQKREIRAMRVRLSILKTIDICAPIYYNIDVIVLIITLFCDYFKYIFRSVTLKCVIFSKLRNTKKAYGA